MAQTLRQPGHATSRKSLADVCFRPAKAELAEASEDSVAFECIEATAGKFKLNDKEMSALLRISQSNYSRRSYNLARVQLLDLEQRRYFIHCYAKTVGLKTDTPTPSDQLKSAAKVAISTLLDLMEAK